MDFTNSENNNFIKRLDDLGRIVIPKELRRKYNIKEGDAFGIIPVAEALLLRPANKQIDN